MIAAQMKGMRRIRYALVGTGMMGQEHIRNLALLRASGEVDAEVVAVVDPNDEMRDAALALAGGLGNARVRAHTHHRALRVGDCDAIVLASPNHTHRQLLEELLPLGTAVLAEKPLCSTLADCEALLPLIERHSEPFWVAMEYRYMPPTARFLERLRSGAAGRLRMLSVREHRYPFLDKVGGWNRFSATSGGTLIEKCCHHFDLMRLITGCEPVRVFASGAQDVNHLDERLERGVPDILDNVMAIVDFENGVRCALELCMFCEGSDPQEQLTAIGDLAKLDAFVPGPDRFRPDAGERHGAVLLSPRSRRAPERHIVTIDERLAAAGDHHGSTYYQHQRFARAILDGAPVEVTAADGAAAVRMGAAAQESIRTGLPVALSV